MNPPPPVTLETERLVLRPFTMDDLDELAGLQAEPSFWWYPFRRGFTVDETRDFLVRTIERRDLDGFAVAAVIERSSGLLAGWAGLAVPHFLPEILPAVEVGWRFGQAFWHRGYATEAGAAWVDHGFFDRGLDEIVSIFEPENEASGAVMARLGFQLDRVIEQPERGVTLHVTRRSRPADGAGGAPA